MIPEGSVLWQYLSSQQKELFFVGAFLIEDRKKHPHKDLRDYSYLVFPFAKMYEGFLKQLFLDLGIISEEDYNGDRFRIGKALSPTLAKKLEDRSAYRQMCIQFKGDLADELWKSWKLGRNQVFHYFPHNLSALSENEALETIDDIIHVMHRAVEETGVIYKRNKRR